MCGRYSFFTPLQNTAELLKAKVVPLFEWQPNYNAAPTNYMPVITNEFPKVIQFFRFGLLPQWSKDVKRIMPNSRYESIIEKPAVEAIFKYKRCIVIADGYYEWKKLNKTEKQAYRFCMPNNGLMLFAGLWDVWGDNLQSFSIITRAATPQFADIHDRMPVLLTPYEATQWLDNNEPPKKKLPLLSGQNNKNIITYPISNLVNSVANNVPEIILQQNTLL
jgi:putative SOS response-associated peptidase YedK